MSGVEALRDGLPGHLRERILLRGEGRPLDGAFVLCWLHHALRVDANPALDAALCAAERLDRPLLVYQGLGGGHRFDSDRHHRFILEAARDLDEALRARGHRLFFHLPEDPSAPSPLRALADRAALAVTELYPVPPFSRWYRNAIAGTGSPWWFVDAACVLPMTLARKRIDRAFAFRRAWADEYEARAPAGLPPVHATAAPFAEDPGFVPFDLTSDLAAAIARCRIDHLVGPVGHTPGGARAARTRWDRFRAQGLAGYANRRNDAAEAWPRGVSRLSPYLHYGCIAPQQVAAEAAAAPGKGPEKFLDELLVWREIVYHFCFRTPDPEILAALPTWAVETLTAHRDDPRDVLDWETLARGRTGDVLWDLAQQSLLRQGELHNNVRMTWAKAVLPWTEGPAEALATLIDLNHRYALDGNDPNSYGGILWCLGQFDRPFTPEQPVLGTVRPRSTEAHARRLDLDAYRQRVLPPAGGRALRCVVVGAGIAGLTAARALADHGHEVVVLDKGRAPGGRASTRRQGGRRFDHGAQYFTARDPRFRRYVEAWQRQGLVAPWDVPIGVIEGGALRRKDGATERFVGAPGMSAIAGHLAADLACRAGTRVVGVTRDAGLTVRCEDGTALTADVVLLALPPSQAEALVAPLPVALPPLPTMEPCWAVLVTSSGRLLAEVDGAFVNDGPLSWVGRQAGRPGRPADECWVLHASSAWSREHLEAEPDAVIAELLAAARALPGAAPFEVLDATAHRWRHARADAPREDGVLWDEALGLGLCGDWLHGSRIEGAFLSGAAAAGRVLGSPRALGR